MTKKGPMDSFQVIFKEILVIIYPNLKHIKN